jgi:hypothetical protein
VEIMSDFRDTFCKQLDSTGSGIKAIIDRLDALLKLHSRPLWEHLAVTTKVWHSVWIPPPPRPSPTLVRLGLNAAVPGVPIGLLVV